MSEEGQQWRALGGGSSPGQPPGQDITPEHGPDGGHHVVPPAPETSSPGPWAAPGSSTVPAAPGAPPPPQHAPPSGPAAQHGWTPPSGPAAPPLSVPTTAPAAPSPAVGLRPHSLGELLNGGFSYLRDNPRTVLGLSFLVVALTSLLPALGLADVTGAYADFFSSEIVNPEDLELSGTALVSVYLGALLQFLGSVLLSGLLSTVVAAAVLGRRLSLRETAAALRGSWGSLWALVGFYLGLVTAAAIVLVLGLLITSVLLVLLPPLGLLLFLLFFAGFIALFGWLMVKTSLAVPAAVVERVGPGRALARSWQLSTGNFWWIAAVLFLALLLSSVLSNVLSTPFSLAAVLVEVPLGESALTSVLAALLSFLGLLVTGCVSEPFTAGVTALLYLDVRMRREGLDLRVREAVRAGATPGPELLVATVPAQPAGRS